METSTAIEKALKILLEFNSREDEFGTFDISKSLNLSKATASRIMNTLAEYGFLLRNPETRKFSLGPWFIAMGLTVSESLHKSLVTLARPHIDRLCREIDETVTFTVFFAPNVVIVYIANKPGMIKINIEVGQITQPNASASAKSIYAFLDPNIADAFLKKELERHTPNTITDRDTLKDHYQKIRACGYAIDNEEAQLGLNALGVPVFNAAGQPIGSVSAVGLSSADKWGSDSPILPKLRETAGKIFAEIYRYSRKAAKES
jgi:DNA-binding IclR family transcriptional regulator